MTWLRRLFDRLILHPELLPHQVTGGESPPNPSSPGPDERYLPRTFRPAAPDDGSVRPRLFEPALLHYGHAFRPGDPTFPDDATAGLWLNLRRVATDHVLRRIADSPWGDRLILRGGLLMKAWLGDEAREPGDLDWVADRSLEVSSADALFDGLVEAIFGGPGPEGVEFIREGVATDEIWTYERTPGRRAVFPWRVEGLPGGAVQVDVAFGEALIEPARVVAIPTSDAGCVAIRAAGPAQSLAWKLVWLHTDIHAQGKDLYDAVLLAERFPLSREILEGAFRQVEGVAAPETAASLVAMWRVDWENFQAEYPWVVGDEGSWLKQLEVAIGPTFGGQRSATLEGKSAPPLDPTWLTPTVVDLAAGIAADRAWDRLPILSDALQEAGCDRADLLSHCLAGGPHARGCWAVDLILEDRGRPRIS